MAVALDRPAVDAMISRYFKQDYKYREICAFMELVHGVRLSLDQLKRRLKKMGLNRRLVRSSLDDIEEAIEIEKAGSGQELGYRALLKRLTQKYELSVARDTVMMISSLMDPDGTEKRKSRKLQRRVYHTKGPNYLWHIDGYDKLKPFGFAIHGAIDGYSRRIIWLEVATTNNDPYVIAGYFVNVVKALGGFSRVIRADCGTENVNIAFIQPFFRSSGTDALAGESSFRYGRSSSHHRIEAWWGQLRR